MASAAGLSGALISWFGAAMSALVSFWLTETPSLELFITLLLIFATLAVLPALLVLFLDRQEAQDGAVPA